MKAFGSLFGAAIVAGAGLAYYVHQRHRRTGFGYLDVIRQLPGEVQRVGDDARRRAAEALEQGIAAAKRRDADLVRRLESAGAPPSDPTPWSPPVPNAATPPAVAPEPTAV
jgi:CRISPR/Cas system-associated protein Csm6